MGYEITEGTKEWLLGHPLPSVRYRALRSISRFSENHPAVIEARAEILRSNPVAKIMSKQAPGGHWFAEEDFYQRTKYKGTVWNLILLAELDTPSGNENVMEACEFLLSHSQVRGTGGFSYRGTARNGGSPGGEIPCLTANMAWALGKLGLEEDIRVRKAVERISKTQRFSTTVPPEDMEMSNHERCWTPRDCRSAAVKALRALVSTRTDLRTSEVSAAILRGISFVIENCLGQNPEDLRSVARKEWFSFGCPNMWNTDLLEIASVLRAARARGPMVDELNNCIADMADAEGRFVQGSPFADRFLTTIEPKGKPSGLLTVRAYELFNS